MNFPAWLDWLYVVLAPVCIGLGAWSLSAWLLPVVPARLRALSAIVVGFYYHAIVFLLLTFTGAFVLPAVIATDVLPGIVGALALWRSPALRKLAAADAAHVRTFLLRIGTGAAGIVTFVTVTVFTLQLVHSTFAPPLAWDALTYHLPRAVFWAETGSLHDGFEAPLAWEYFRAFWPIGDSLSAWALLVTKSDLWIPHVWAFVWICGVGASYVLARELKARRSHAWIAALAVWSMPALARHAYVAHIENLMLMLIVAGAALLIAAEREREPLLLMLGLAALAEACIIKPSALPYAAAGAIAYGFIGVRRLRAQPWAVLLAPIPAFVVSLPVLIRNAVLHDSPMYPFRLELGGTRLFEASPEFVYILTQDATMTQLEYLERFFLIGPYGGYVTHVNFGAPALALFALGLFGFARVVVRGPSRFATGVFVGFSCLALVMFLESYTWTGNNVGRHVATVPLFLVACAATFRGTWARTILAVAGLGGLVFFLPFNWHEPDRKILWGMLEALTGSTVVVVALLAVAWRSTRPRYVALALAALVAFGAYVTPNIERKRARVRYDFYASAGKSRSYTNIRLGGRSGVAFDSHTIWQKLDRPNKPRNIAVTAGWDRRGINWALYPLFGRELQNRVMYIPPTRSGRTISPRLSHEYRQALDYEAWKQRLAANDVHFVVSYFPSTPEARWMIGHPADFEIVHRMGQGKQNILARTRFTKPRSNRR